MERERTCPFDSASLKKGKQHLYLFMECFGVLLAAPGCYREVGTSPSGLLGSFALVLSGCCTA